MQKRNGRSCGKVPVRLIKWSVCYYSPEPFTASGNFCFTVFVFVELNGGERESDSNDLLSSFLFFCFFFFFASLFPSPLALCRFLLPLLRIVFVRETAVKLIVFCPCNSSYLLRVALSVQQGSVPLQHVRCSSCSLSFPFRSSCITSFSTPSILLRCFVSFSSSFSSLVFCCLACFVVLSYPVR